jgi:hypothetical protein
MIRRPSFNWAPLENTGEGLMGELSNARHERFAQELEKTVPLRLVRCRSGLSLPSGATPRQDSVVGRPERKRIAA